MGNGQKLGFGLVNFLQIRTFERLVEMDISSIRCSFYFNHQFDDYSAPACVNLCNFGAQIYFIVLTSCLCLKLTILADPEFLDEILADF